MRCHEYTVHNIMMICDTEHQRKIQRKLTL